MSINDHRTHVAIAVLLLSIAQTAIAQTVQFNNRYDFGSSEVSGSIEGSDNGHIITGGHINLESWQRELVLFEIDSLGNKTWERFYRKKDFSYYQGSLDALRRISDGNYILPGSFAASSRVSRANLFKFSPTGDSIWRTEHRPGGYCTFLQARELSSGNIMCVGTHRPPRLPLGPFRLNQLILVKFSPQGEIVWDTTYNTGSYDTGYSLVVGNEDSLFIGVSRNESPSNDQRDHVIIKTDSMGAIDWERSFGGPADDFIPILNLLNNGDVMLSSNWIDDNFTNPLGYGFLARVAANGTVIWSNTYGPRGIFNALTSVREQDNGNLLCLGSTQYLNNPNEFIGWLLQVSADGDSLREKRFEHNIADTFTSIHYLYDLELTADGGFICNGTMIPTATVGGTQDIWVAKFDSLWCSQPNCDPPNTVKETSQQAGIRLYPNPTTGLVTVDFSQDSPQPVEIILFDATGRIQLRKTVQGKTVTIDLVGLATGLYFAKITRPNKSPVTVRILKQ